MSIHSDIIELLPYKPPFHFVDEIIQMDDETVTGSYRIKKDEYYFEGHFPRNPIVPGAILGEIMAQIGLVCLGLYLTDPNDRPNVLPAFSSMQVDFLSFAKPGDLLIVESKKIYFRFGKLKCQVSCKKENGTIIAKGELAGMIIKQQ